MIRFFSVSIFFILGFVVRLQAQQPAFLQANVVLPQLQYSACAWGDFDSDGDLDLALTGIENNDPVSKIFRNDNRLFTDIEAGLIPVHNGTVEWGDYDNDNDLDLLLTGIDIVGVPFTMIYQNSNGIFTDSGISLPGIIEGQATWGDYDNDGDLDILLLGNLISEIYRNDGNNSFINITNPFPLMENPMGCWLDYDNNGQLDVMVCGNTGNGVFSKLYSNNHGIFTEVSVGPGPFLGLQGGQIKCADLDNDGDKDIVITGFDVNIEGYFLQYRNDGNDHFTKYAEHTSNLVSASIDLGDFNADGFMDILLMGRCVGCGGTSVTELYQNLGSFSFLGVVTTLPGFKQGGISWGDYNNDGFTDLIFTGTDAREAPRTGIFMNTLGDTSFFSPNTPPAITDGFNVSVENDKLLLHWNRSHDGQTPKNALSYNIRIGTQPAMFDIVAPMADLNNGFRTIVSPGNAGSDTSWIITGIPAGTYYLSVQAIDNGFMPGEFSAPYMFNYAPVGIDGKNTTEPVCVYPNPFTENLQISGKNSSSGLILVYNSKGEMVYDGHYNCTLNTTNWQKGLYLIRIMNGENNSTTKAMKN